MGRLPAEMEAVSKVCGTTNRWASRTCAVVGPSASRGEEWSYCIKKSWISNVHCLCFSFCIFWSRKLPPYSPPIPFPFLPTCQSISIRQTHLSSASSDVQWRFWSAVHWMNPDAVQGMYGLWWHSWSTSKITEFQKRMNAGHKHYAERI